MHGYNVHEALHQNYEIYGLLIRGSAQENIRFYIHSMRDKMNGLLSRFR